jgi:hypothetical protein
LILSLWAIYVDKYRIVVLISFLDAFFDLKRWANWDGNFCRYVNKADDAFVLFYRADVVIQTCFLGRVTRWICEKNAQYVAQFFHKHNLYRGRKRTSQSKKLHYIYVAENGLIWSPCSQAADRLCTNTNSFIKEIYHAISKHW